MDYIDTFDKMSLTNIYNYGNHSRVLIIHGLYILKKKNTWTILIHLIRRI